ncbi:uncharacterized protein [Rutidosis leptorrhynchoides]|uniref:uncharacterized protein n=1 Tax=Rutidosis leptorrhynchoides TaxID=125765 RepID=UPI003A99BB06
MPFGLKNDGATYQRVVDVAFKDQIDRKLEVYIDDLVIKSNTKVQLLAYISEMFKSLRKINMKLNPAKCSFVEEAGKLAALTSFLSKVVERSLLEMKTLIREGPTLTAPIAGETLMLYLVTSKEDISSFLVADRGQVQMPVYFVTKALSGSDVNYPPMENICASTHSSAAAQVDWLSGPYEACEPEGTGAILVLMSPDGEEQTYALRFTFDATNIESDYEALLSAMRIAQQLGIKYLDMYVDSQLVANQVNGSFEVPRGQKKKADALIKLPALAFDHLHKNVWVEVLTEKSVNEKLTVAPIEEENQNWMTPLVKFLTDGKLPVHEKEARKIRMKVLIRKSYLRRSLLCIIANQAKEVLLKVHEGYCALHSGYRTIAANVMCIGYY